MALPGVLETSATPNRMIHECQVSCPAATQVHAEGGVAECHEGLFNRQQACESAMSNTLDPRDHMLANEI